MAARDHGVAGNMDAHTNGVARLKLHQLAQDVAQGRGWLPLFGKGVEDSFFHDRGAIAHYLELIAPNPPQDLPRIQQKLRDGGYESLQEVEKDLYTIPDNAERYHAANWSADSQGIVAAAQEFVELLAAAGFGRPPRRASPSAPGQLSEASRASAEAAPAAKRAKLNATGADAKQAKAKAGSPKKAAAGSPRKLTAAEEQHRAQLSSPLSDDDEPQPRPSSRGAGAAAGEKPQSLAQSFLDGALSLTKNVREMCVIAEKLEGAKSAAEQRISAAEAKADAAERQRQDEQKKAAQRISAAEAKADAAEQRSVFANAAAASAEQQLKDKGALLKEKEQELEQLIRSNLSLSRQLQAAKAQVNSMQQAAAAARARLPSPRLPPKLAQKGWLPASPRSAFSNLGNLGNLGRGREDPGWT